MSASGVRQLDHLLAELREPIAQLGATELTPERIRPLLHRIERRAWRLEEPAAPGPLAGRCPIESSRAELALARPSATVPAAGAYLAGSCLPVAPARWVVLGMPAIVTPGQASELERLLASLRAPRAEFWRVHGGVVVRAARAAARANACRPEPAGYETSAGSSLPASRSRPRWTAAMNFDRLTSSVPRISSA